MTTNTYVPKYFKTTDFVDYSSMSEKLIRFLDDLREKANSPIFVSSSNSKGKGIHVTNSQHYLGNAVDIIFTKWSGTFEELIAIIEKIGFTGIGIYPHWHYNGKTVVGFHLDVRPTAKVARWVGVMNPVTKKQDYIAWSDKNLRKYKLIA